MGMPMITWPRVDFELIRDPVGAAIRETVGYDWNIETETFEIWKTSYSNLTEIHNDPEQFRMEIDNLKEIHTIIFPQESAIKGRLNKHKFNSLFNPLESFCATTLPTSEQAESGEWAGASLDQSTADAIRLKIYQAVHEMFEDVEHLNHLFDLTIYADGAVQEIAVLTVVLYVRFYAHRRRIGPRESQRLKLGTVLAPMYWQILLMGFDTKRKTASQPFHPNMSMIDQTVELAAQMEQQVRQVDFSRMVDANAKPEVREAGEVAIQAGMAFGLLDERGRLIDFPDF
ncbi:uncharacterized protein LTHEOB_2232 [Lasiodiplodia theobromae]|uniref:uncharacterized protein n=1 Tax=Lasiodiplodia theobromae TaxID=45133 RepID=UPI0015C30807|nr:uncharacterized protein LTHEOB_2232 [Lasiodiplodia theobromae]KAF4536471.1 hypothetical protein LTHEOB_2232 [Lasiodiplodia theobromae]